MAGLRLFAYAKVNLGLAVLAQQPDGFHAIETLMARVALHDVVDMNEADRGVTLSVLGADLPEDDRNLAVRAARAYLGPSAALAIRLRKAIPVAAGLGGGSSDAAAVLRGLATLYPGAADPVAIAPDLGSDVPFFVADVPAAFATGRGEKLRAVSLPRLNLVLVDPGVPVSAGDAYAALSGPGVPLPLQATVAGLAGTGPVCLRNDLQVGVAALHPVIADVLRALEGAGLRGVSMSGSGSTCFGIALDAAAAQRAASGLRAAQPGWRTFATQTL